MRTIAYVRVKKCMGSTHFPNAVEENQQSPPWITSFRRKRHWRLQESCKRPYPLRLDRAQTRGVDSHERSSRNVCVIASEKRIGRVEAWRRKDRYSVATIKRANLIR